MNIYKFSPSPKTKANAISAIEWQDIFSWWKWPPMLCCDLLKNSYLCLLNNTRKTEGIQIRKLWFAEKFVSLLIEQHLCTFKHYSAAGCDLLKNSYLCLLNNTDACTYKQWRYVVICWKIRIFAYWTTPVGMSKTWFSLLWFAEKFVSLLIEQHQCRFWYCFRCVVICWKIRIFAYWTTPDDAPTVRARLLWFAEKFVSLLIEQHQMSSWGNFPSVVICWKIRIFAYWTTPSIQHWARQFPLWFAEKFVSLLIEQHLTFKPYLNSIRCDLLKNSYLCLLNNTCEILCILMFPVVICWKIRIFAYWTTPWRH